LFLEEYFRGLESLLGWDKRINTILFCMHLMVDGGSKPS